MRIEGALAFWRQGIDWSRMPWYGVLMVLATGSAVRVGRLATGMLKLRLLRRNACRVVAFPREIETLTLFGNGTAEVLVSPDVPGPATFGCLQSTILLPMQYESMDSGERLSILCHELIHVRRRDWLFVFGEQMVLALFWFHSAVWWLIHRIELAREQVVDREVLALSIDRRQYLNALLLMVSKPAAHM